MAKKITFGLSVNEISKAIAQLQQYRNEFKLKSELLIQRLVDEGVNIAKVNVQMLGANYTGELENSIEGYYSPSLGVGIIYAGAWYAVYVEFGTGVVGQQSPHPDPQNWQYDINGHGEDGWWYFNDNDGQFHWTKGMESRPFMWNTAKYLDSVCEKIAKEVFNS